MRDLLVVGLSFVLAFGLRYLLAERYAFGLEPNRQETLIVGFWACTLWGLVAWQGGLYVSWRSRGVFAEIFDVARVTILTFLVLVTFTYFFRDERFSRLTLGFWAGCNFALVSTGRILTRLILRVLRTQGYNLRHVLIVGSGDLAKRVVDTVRAQAHLGLRSVGLVVPEAEKAKVGTFIHRTPVIGSVNQLNALLAKKEVDQVIVALPVEKMVTLKRLMAKLSQETVDVRLVPDFVQYMTLCGSVEEFSGLPIINLQSTPMAGWNRVFKRVFDFSVSISGMLFGAPLFLLISLWIRFNSKGPIFYRQERVGMDGQTFEMVKFRTMTTDAEEQGAQMTLPEDPRVTGIGRILRKLSLDELPQLWNVLLGEMSLVGPRPERPIFIEEFKKEIPRYALRHKIKAGMTGWAQINGMRGKTSIAKRIEFDLYYIENWSFRLDMKILLKTALGGFLSRNAY